MCGRYSIYVPPDVLETQFDIEVGEAYQPRYNAAPSQSLPVITDDTDGQLSFMEWGFVPPWAADKDEGGHINARGETVAEKPSFKHAFAGETVDSLRTGRCLVPADGFYEWAETNGGKQPYRITLTGDRPFAMAGLWAQFRPETTQAGLDAFTSESKAPDETIIETFTILTTSPNAVVEDLHDRMAVILPPGREREWLTADPDTAVELLAPLASDEMRAYPVSTAVNDPSNDSPAVVEPIDEESAS